MSDTMSWMCCELTGGGVESHGTAASETVIDRQSGLVEALSTAVVCGRVAAVARNVAFRAWSGSVGLAPDTRPDQRSCIILNAGFTNYRHANTFNLRNNGSGSKRYTLCEDNCWGAQQKNNLMGMLDITRQAMINQGISCGVTSQGCQTPPPQ